MKRYVAVVMLICTTHIVWSQVRPKVLERNMADWHYGWVLLVTGDTVHCDLSFNPAVGDCCK